MWWLEGDLGAVAEGFALNRGLREVEVARGGGAGETRLLGGPRRFRRKMESELRLKVECDFVRDWLRSGSRGGEVAIGGTAVGEFAVEVEVA